MVVREKGNSHLFRCERKFRNAVRHIRLNHCPLIGHSHPLSNFPPLLGTTEYSRVENHHHPTLAKRFSTTLRFILHVAPLLPSFDYQRKVIGKHVATCCFDAIGNHISICRSTQPCLFGTLCAASGERSVRIRGCVSCRCYDGRLFWFCSKLVAQCQCHQLCHCGW